MEPFRKYHKISGRGGEQLPRRIVSLAVATQEKQLDGRSHQSLVSLEQYACVLYVDNGESFQKKANDVAATPALFWELLDKWAIGSGYTMVIAHNASEAYTVMGLWYLLDTNHYTLSSPAASWRNSLYGENEERGACCLEDPPIILDCWRGQHRICFVGIENYCGPNYRDDKRLPVLIRSDDLGCTFKRWLEQWRSGNNGAWGMTASSLSWNSFKRSSGAKQIEIHGDTSAIKLERASVYGGHCEARYIGIVPERLHSLDVRSYYPSLMATAAYPVSLSGYYEKPLYPGQVYISSGEAAIAEVCIRSPGYRFPVRAGGITWLANGSYWTVLAGPELQHAYEIGAVEAIGRHAIYALGFPFAIWVGKWAKRRKTAIAAGDGSGNALCKLVLNSLWGKFLSRAHGWVHSPAMIPATRWGHWTHFDYGEAPPVNCRGVAGKAFTQQDNGEWAHSFPAISAFVLSYGRLLTARIIALAGERNVYYVDTDGFLVNSDGLDRLHAEKGLVGNGIGQLRYTGANDQIEIIGTKHYWSGDTLTCGGLKIGSERIDNIRYLARVRQRAGSILDGCPRDNYESWLSVFKADGTYPKGRIGADGWVIPRSITETTEHATF